MRTHAHTSARALSAPSASHFQEGLPLRRGGPGRASAALLQPRCHRGSGRTRQIDATHKGSRGARGPRADPESGALCFLPSALSPSCRVSPLLSPEPTESPANTPAPEPPRDAPSASRTALSAAFGGPASSYPVVPGPRSPPRAGPLQAWAHPGLFRPAPQPRRTPQLRPGDFLRWSSGSISSLGLGKPWRGGKERRCC